MKMNVPTGESVVRPVTTTENLIKPVPKPFSIEALIGDTPSNKSSNSWSSPPHQHLHTSRDTDSDGSLDIDLAQDLSRRNQRDSKMNMILVCSKLKLYAKSVVYTHTKIYLQKSSILMCTSPRVLKTFNDKQKCET